MDLIAKVQVGGDNLSAEIERMLSAANSKQLKSTKKVVDRKLATYS